MRNTFAFSTFTGLILGTFACGEEATLPVRNLGSAQDPKLVPVHDEELPEATATGGDGHGPCDQPRSAAATVGALKTNFGIFSIECTAAEADIDFLADGHTGTTTSSDAKMTTFVPPTHLTCPAGCRPKSSVGVRGNSSASPTNGGVSPGYCAKPSYKPVEASGGKCTFRVGSVSASSTACSGRVDQGATHASVAIDAMATYCECPGFPFTSYKMVTSGGCQARMMSSYRGCGRVLACDLLSGKVASCGGYTGDDLPTGYDDCPIGMSCGSVGLVE